MKSRWHENVVFFALKKEKLLGTKLRGTPEHTWEQLSATKTSGHSRSKHKSAFWSDWRIDGNDIS